MVTERLVLRRWNPEDERDVAALRDLYQHEEVTRYLSPGFRPVTSMDDAARLLETWHAGEHPRPELGYWAITTLVDRTPIGGVLLRPLLDANEVETDDIEIGAHLHPDHWGRGFAAEAAGRLIEHAWSLEIDEVNALIHPDNIAGQALAGQLGLTLQELTDHWYGANFQWWLLGAPLSPAA